MPNDASKTAAQYEFGPFRLDAASRALYRNADFVPLTPKAAEILLLLVQEAGRVVTKEQLLERVWPGVIVEEGTIANNISTLRKVIECDEFGADGPIATVPRRGYRFTAPVRAADVFPARTAEVIPAHAADVTPAEPAPGPPKLGAGIQEAASILIAEIENRTGDPVFDGTIRQALLLHLAQSPYLEILTDRRILSVLGYMGKQSSPVTGEVALEVCQRAGATAVISGSIFAFGDEYLIGLQALQGSTGAILVSEQARAHGKGEVLKALDAAAIGLRTKLGESFSSITRFSREFGEVATTSLEAVKAYSTARLQWIVVGEQASKVHFLRAIELDPDFASAYSALAHVCNNMGQTQEAIQCMQKAYEVRSRSTEREWMRIEAGYHALVTGDKFKGLEATRLWQLTYPRDTTAFTNGADVMMDVGQWDKAVAASQRAYALESTPISASNLAIALMAVGRHDEARATLQDAFARGYDTFYLHLDAYQEAFLRGDTSAMKRHADAVAGRPCEEDYLLAAQADTEAYHGRHVRARELSARAVESARRAEAIEMSAVWQAEAALREAEIGELERARDGAKAGLETFKGRDVSCLAAYVLARCGDFDDALRLAAELDREYPQHTIVQRYWLPGIRAAVALGTKDWKAAIDALEPALAVELGQSKPFEGGLMIPPYLRGLALLGASRRDDAKTEFMKIVERPGLIKNFPIYPLARAKVE
jgi:DNA-binding winged helix-turn-helix (wHTH) protein/tetratricopeptide (TPR) repeat protein